MISMLANYDQPHIKQDNMNNIIIVIQITRIDLIIFHTLFGTSWDVLLYLLVLFQSVPLPSGLVLHRRISHPTLHQTTDTQSEHFILLPPARFFCHESLTVPSSIQKTLLLRRQTKQREGTLPSHYPQQMHFSPSCLAPNSSFSLSPA